MGNVKVRYFVAKKQKGHNLYYWQPKKGLHQHGFLPRRLARSTNDLADAIREAEVLNRELDAWRNGELVAKEPTFNTLPWLIKNYQQSEKYSGLAKKTQRGYDQNMKLIEAWSHRAGHPPLDSITPLAVEKFHKGMSSTPHQANAVIRVLRILMGRAYKLRLIPYNPAAKPDLKSLPPRDQQWSDDEITKFIDAAVASGRRSIALAVIIGAELGQREGDVLHLAWSQYDGTEITLKQQKTGRPISVPVTGVLKKWLDETDRQSTQIVLSEGTGRPYKEDNFRHLFSEVRSKAEIRSDLQFRDLRRTAAIRLAEAGCTAFEVAAVTGHNIETAQAILETYAPRTKPMAQSAIRKLEENKNRP